MPVIQLAFKTDHIARVRLRQAELTAARRIAMSADPRKVRSKRLTSQGHPPISALREARWRSGYVGDCKSPHAGSIPARASTSSFQQGFALVKAAIFLLAATLLTACHAEAAPLVTVSEAKAIALPTSAAVYFTLANSGGRDRLLSVAADAEVGKASLHQTSMDGDIMRMRAIEEGIEIPARGRVRLSTNGRHVMIQNLTRPLAPGSSVRLTLRFERQGKVAIQAPVSGPR